MVIEPDKQSVDEQNITNDRITGRTTGSFWDSMAKGIAEIMPSQLVLLVNEIFHKSFPPDTGITQLSTEYPTKAKDKKQAYSRLIPDITFRINGYEDIYHFEFQMTKSKLMVIRVLKYDFHISMRYSVKPAGEPSAFESRFPVSAIIYPAKETAPKRGYESCKIIYPDGTSHTYRVPAITISDYTVSELFEKKLYIFLPFTIFQFRTRLRKNARSPVTKKELTDHLREVILGLDEKKQQGVIDQHIYEELVCMIGTAVSHVFQNHPDYIKEAEKMTKGRFMLLRDIIQEQKEQLEEKDNALAAYKDENARLKARLSLFEAQQPDLAN